MSSSVRVRILGVGMGPHHVTGEVAEALRTVDYVLAAEKSDDDRLLALRQEILRQHPGPGGPAELVVVPDPPRDRSEGLSAGGYEGAVADWHDARAARYAEVLRQRGGTAAFLVWGDPSLYDSTIRVVERVRDLGVDLDFDVLPGISAPQLLAARHRIVLHEVGRPVHVTTGRRLQEAVTAGLDNIVAMLNPPPHRLDFTGLEDWTIWWGANLGAPGERLLTGRLDAVRPAIGEARTAAEARDGWVMDLFLVRRT
ncbi:precorrin-6A synthase (deacetylating) [Mycolicibacterium duvalii]|uniref:Precorrin-6A synthase (Deacetylating) n=1 Tax=Mycolicibacterium duvalii TaxID=39688 RepID=A0A7I7K6T8_9MYCO|nr:precorrin-6A synthase (deacetylating) [Mycolicibacterium duvalii]MCV7368968.1 precorrin-6A synthase (deacetylating) [Mycolicibacterium duvalii]PEG44450.1 precorrin-6A synthase (deacetylating) [Mycolicibacterium duvalii]BBX19132.1 precorrin-6A synthase (deacetylating) [Mycolicibacterium duvalii]